MRSLIHVVACFLSYTTFSYSNDMIWISNHAGLFSHYLSFKVMHSFAKKFGRTLVTTPHDNAHLNETLNLCEIFDFNNTIICLNSLINRTDCMDSLSLAQLRSTIPVVCSTAPIKEAVDLPYNPDTKDFEKHKANKVAKRIHFLKAVDMPGWHLKFTTKYETIVDNYYTALGYPADDKYIVVHWRRGDQIGRCLNKEDQSVNCESATSLINAVKPFITNLQSKVYVATNEQNADELQTLAAAGFKTSVDKEFQALQLNNLDLFVAEVGLMLNATTFLAWGISEVDNVVEAERRARGLSWCMGTNATYAAMHANSSTLVEATWCALQNGLPLNFGEFSSGQEGKGHIPKSPQQKNEKKGSKVSSKSDSPHVEDRRIDKTKKKNSKGSKDDDDDKAERKRRKDDTRGQLSRRI